MRPWLAVLLAVVPAAPLAAQRYDQLAEPVRRYVSVADPVVALVNVTVVDGTGAPARGGQVVLVRDGRIAAVGAAGAVTVPAGARVLDLAGHTVLPGFVGMHDHTFYMTSLRSVQMNFTGPLLYLGSGVTTIRTTGSYSPYSELNLKRGVEKGLVPGPRMHITGPYLTGETGVGSMHNLLDEQTARRVVNYWADEGATWLKFYTTVSRAVMGAAIDEAHRRGLKVTGHLCSVTYREAVALGIDALEHGLFANTDYDPGKQADLCPADALPKLAALDLGSDAVRETFRAMVGKGVAMTSTLAIYEAFVPNRPPLEQRVLEMMSNDVKTEYLASRARLAEPGAFAIAPEVFRKAQAYELAFHRAGGLLAAGVDPTGNGGALPGFGDQRNYELLIEAGFTPLEAVRVMTLNGAKVLGEDAHYGSIEPGKLADLVVIKGDPIARPAEIRNVVTVFKEGVGYDSATLLAACRGLVGIR